MSSRLQLDDVLNLSLGRRHLVNVYEVKAGIGVIACIKLCDSCLSILRVYHKNKDTYLYLLYR